MTDNQRPKETNPEQLNVDTGGGAYISGDVITQTFVGRDLIIAIERGATVIVKHAHTQMETIDKAHQIAERRLIQSVANLANSYQRLSETPLESQERSPYQALLDYKLEDAPFFYGREQAITDLWQHIHQGRLTILHSESGAGKSSLLQAGIAARLLSSGQLPLYIRPYKKSPTKAIKEVFLPDVAHMEELEHIQIQSLRGFLQTVCSALEQPLTIFLDQFEEFFVELDISAQTHFFNELSDCLQDSSLSVRWVLSLRREQLFQLSQFRPQIPTIFANEYYLEKLNQDEALQAIEQPALQRNVQYESGLVHRIMGDLAGESGFVDPPQLQIVCYYLFGERETDTITTTLYRAERNNANGAQGILSNHLQQVLSRMPSQQSDIARQVLKELITSDNRRIQYSQDNLYTILQYRHSELQADHLNLVINSLVDSRLLRLEQDANVELAHDYLLTQIELDPETQARKLAQEIIDQEVVAWRNNRDLRIPEDKLTMLVSQQDQLVINDDAQTLLDLSKVQVETEQRKKERGRRLLQSSVLLLTIALLGALYFYYAADLAKDQESAARELERVARLTAQSEAMTREAAQGTAVASEAEAQIAADNLSIEIRLVP